MWERRPRKRIRERERKERERQTEREREEERINIIRKKFDAIHIHNTFFFLFPFFRPSSLRPGVGRRKRLPTSKPLNFTLRESIDAVPSLPKFHSSQYRCNIEIRMFLTPSLLMAIIFCDHVLWRLPYVWVCEVYLYYSVRILFFSLSLSLKFLCHSVTCIRNFTQCLVHLCDTGTRLVFFSWPN